MIINEKKELRGALDIVRNSIIKLIIEGYVSIIYYY
jgi:hypothetical protein